MADDRNKLVALVVERFLLGDVAQDDYIAIVADAVGAANWRVCCAEANAFVGYFGSQVIAVLRSFGGMQLVSELEWLFILINDRNKIVNTFASEIGISIK